MPGQHGDGEVDGREPRPGRTAACVGRMACDWRSDAAAVCAHGGGGERGRARTGMRGRRNARSFELRYASKRFCDRRRPAMGAVEAAVTLVACLRARPAGKKIWKW